MSKLDPATRQAGLLARRARLSPDKHHLLQRRLRGELPPAPSASPAPRSCLVDIQPKGAKPPFFCVHPLGGDVLCFFPLARCMGSDQPFYGFQSHGLQQDLDPLKRIEEMAALYVGEMRKVQPDGPHLIGGWSFGGLVAFEMAQQLHAQGSPASLLAILDTTPGMEPQQAVEIRSADIYRDNRSWLLSIAQYVEGLWGRRLELSASALERMAPDEQLSYFVERVKGARLMSSNVTLDQLRRLLNVFKSNSRAWCAYVPRLYPGRITVIRSALGVVPFGDSAQSADVARGAFSDDPALGWGQFSSVPVEVRTVPGSHITMLAEPNVNVLATQLQACLETRQSVACCNSEVS
ncbi:MAG: thioesterase domain-containing protein [Acidobacteriota bacterium]